MLTATNNHHNTHKEELISSKVRNQSCSTQLPVAPQVHPGLVADFADAAASLALLHRTSRHLLAAPQPTQRRPRKQARPVACC